MTPSPDLSARHVDALQRKRTRMTFFQAAMFVLWQANFLALDGEATSVSLVKVGSYLVWAALLLAFIATGGNWWERPELRKILNDETTRAHRQRALSLGFFAAMATALGAYVVVLVRPLPSPLVIHLVLTAGLAVALCTFAVLERRAQADG